MVPTSRWCCIAMFLVALWFAACRPNNFVGRRHLQQRTPHREDKAAFFNPLKLEKVPRLPRAASIDIADYTDDFYKVAMADADNMGKDIDAYLNEMLKSADNFILGDELWDREEFEESLVRAITRRGSFTLVLGGKSVGKSFIKDKAIIKVQQERSDITIIDVDMRGMSLQPESSLAKSVENAQRETEITSSFGFALPGLMGVITDQFFNIFLDKYPDAKFIAMKTSEILKGAVAKSQNEGIDALLSRITKAGKFPAVVIDEANLVLPTRGEGMEGAKRALAYFVKLTKQRREGSVVMISSEYAFPFRLRAIGFALSDIDTVVLAKGVGEEDMLRLLTERWGMSEALARIFYKYYAGHIFSCYRALRTLVEKKSKFDPFFVSQPINIQACINDSQALQHLRNIASQGYSFILSEDDPGAQRIVETDVGGVVSRAAIFGLPSNVWNTTNYEYAVIPSSFFMRLKICRALEQLPHPFFKRVLRKVRRFWQR